MVFILKNNWMGQIKIQFNLYIDLVFPMSKLVCAYFMIFYE